MRTPIPRPPQGCGRRSVLLWGAAMNSRGCAPCFRPAASSRSPDPAVRARRRLAEEFAGEPRTIARRVHRRRVPRRRGGPDRRCRDRRRGRRAAAHGHPPGRSRADRLPGQRGASCSSSTTASRSPIRPPSSRSSPARLSGLVIVATGRRPLHVPGEQLFPIGGLVLDRASDLFVDGPGWPCPTSWSTR